MCVIPNATATADGADEDGVTIPSNASRGATVPFVYSVTNSTLFTAKVNAWGGAIGLVLVARGIRAALATGPASAR